MNVGGGGVGGIELKGESGGRSFIRLLLSSGLVYWFGIESSSGYVVAGVGQAGGVKQ